MSENEVLGIVPDDTGFLIQGYNKPLSFVACENLIKSNDKNKELKQKLAIAKEALEFYANDRNYSGGYYDTVSNGAEDKAKDALEKLSEK